MTVQQLRSGPAAARVEDMLAQRLMQITGQLSRLRGNETTQATQTREDLKAEMAEIRQKLADRRK